MRISKDGIFVGVMCGLACAAGQVFQAWRQDRVWRREILARGCAEWTVDPKTGKTEWQWTCGTEPEK